MDGIGTIIVTSISGLLMLFGGFRFVVAQVESLRRELISVERNTHVYADKVGESEAAQRHALANQTQIILNKFESDIRGLQRDTVKQDQMEALERRLGTLVGRLEVKVDRLSEASSEIIAMKQTLEAIAFRMDKINDKLDSRNT